VTTEALVSDIVELAGIPTPTFAEEARLEWLAARLAGAPGKTRRDDVGNLVWSWGARRPRLAVLAHVDTVFPADAPLRFVDADGRLSGPGIGDNATAVVVALSAVNDVLTAGTAAPGALVFTVGEEGLGNLRGARHACDSLAPALVVAVEGHGLEKVIVDAVGSVRARVRVQGPGGHSWVDRGAPSAIQTAAALATRLGGLGTPETPVNVGTIAGGQSVNTIAASAELVVEMRSLEDRPLDDFRSALTTVGEAEPCHVTVEELGRRPAGRLDRSSHLLRAVRSVRAALGLPDELGEGSTDANAALARGIPALTLGCAQGGAMHTTDEWIAPETRRARAQAGAGPLRRTPRSLTFARRRE